MGKFDICDIPVSTITTGLEGKIIGLFGTNNVGKSYVAARLFPNKTLWLATEKGYNAQGGLRPYDIENWNDFREDMLKHITSCTAFTLKLKNKQKFKVTPIILADSSLMITYHKE